MDIMLLYESPPPFLLIHRPLCLGVLSPQKKSQFVSMYLGKASKMVQPNPLYV